MARDQLERDHAEREEAERDQTGQVPARPDPARRAESSLDHCFVFGCGRTGSTPLVRLLGMHEQLAIGMERYKYVLREVRQRQDPDLFTPALFEPERFLDFRPTDTNLLPPRFEEHYDPIRARLAAGSITQIGDKLVPIDLFNIRVVADHFPRARFVFVFRDLVRVANSFEVRAHEPRDVDWPVEHGYQVGCRQWVEAFDLADSLIARVGVERVFPIHTNLLFRPDGHLRDALFAFLGLEPTAAVREAFARVTPQWSERQRVPVILDPSTQRQLLERQDRHQVARYQRWAELTAAAAGGSDRAGRRLAQHIAVVQAEADLRAQEVEERTAQSRRRRRALAEEVRPVPA